MKKTIRWVLLLALLGFVTSCFATDSATTGGGVLNSVKDTFLSNAASWKDVFLQEATWLYWTLATISFVWTFGLMALQKSDAGDIFVELVKYIMFTGIFWWLLQNGPDFSQAIINSLTELAAKASGKSDVIMPSSVVDVGFDIFNTAVRKFSMLGLGESIMSLLISLIVLVVLAVVAIELLILYISAYFIAYAGIILLGFGGNKWMNEIAINYYRKILALGIELMAMVLIVGIGQKFITDTYAKIGNDFNFGVIGALLVASIALLLIAQKIPALLASIVPGGGGGTGGFGALSATASMAIGAAAGAAGGMKMAKMMGVAGVSAAGSVAAQVGGVAKAVGAAGSAAMGQGIKHVPDLTAKIAANLAKGAGKEAKAMGGRVMGAASNMASRANSAMDSTVGGRVAGHIKNSNKPKDD
jgi:type IV secretion system protein TrbL